MDVSQSSQASKAGSSAAKPIASMAYICGGTLNAEFMFNFPILECNSENQIKPKDQIRCRECGHRVLYKKRTRNRKFLCRLTVDVGMLFTFSVIVYDAR